MKTAIILGTSRKNGNTSQLVDVFLQNTKADVFNLSDFIMSPFDYEHNNLSDDFLSLIDKVLNYEYIIFATPVYWYSMSAQMKIFFDRMSDLVMIEKERGRKLRGKFCALIATGYDNVPAECFEKPFVLSADYFGMLYKGMLYCSCPDTFSELDYNSKIVNFIKSA
ncbi:hypothetical protein MNBD_UNCLBAC01-2044 [hydrothermal vent metagenome]|uniref:NADPH-dependent FMN reductase-like domain-containing protein n=1 Tax=hydrothermal vent metagenome TaxID=652676 RepID=A0A3B1DT28_9ZZZZ